MWLLQRREGSLMSDASPDWDSQLFLVCVHNVASDQPYTIIQAPTSSCAQDIVTQVRVEVMRRVGVLEVLLQSGRYTGVSPTVNPVVNPAVSPDVMELTRQFCSTPLLLVVSTQVQPERRYIDADSCNG